MLSKSRTIVLYNNEKIEQSANPRRVNKAKPIRLAGVAIPSNPGAAALSAKRPVKRQGNSRADFRLRTDAVPTTCIFANNFAGRTNPALPNAVYSSNTQETEFRQMQSWSHLSTSSCHLYLRLARDSVGSEGR